MRKEDWQLSCGSIPCYRIFKCDVGNVSAQPKVQPCQEPVKVSPSVISVRPSFRDGCASVHGVCFLFLRRWLPSPPPSDSSGWVIFGGRRCSPDQPWDGLRGRQPPTITHPNGFEGRKPPTEKLKTQTAH